MIQSVIRMYICRAKILKLIGRQFYYKGTSACMYCCELICLYITTCLCHFFLLSPIFIQFYLLSPPPPYTILLPHPPSPLSRPYLFISSHFILSLLVHIPQSVLTIQRMIRGHLSRLHLILYTEMLLVQLVDIPAGTRIQRVYRGYLGKWQGGRQVCKQVSRCNTVVCNIALTYLRYVYIFILYPNLSLPLLLPSSTLYIFQDEKQ